jgi:hypothetical protein
MGGEASRRHGGEQGGFVSASGLAHHQISRLDPRGPVGQGGGLVEERGGSAGAAVEHDHMALADIAPDDPDKGRALGVGFIRAILWELMIVCGRLPGRRSGPFNSSGVARKRVDDPDDDGRKTQSRGGQSVRPLVRVAAWTTASHSHGAPNLTSTSRDNREASLGLRP